MTLATNNYQESLNKIKQIIITTKEQIQHQVNYEKIKMAWNIGQVIAMHLDSNKKRGYKNDFFETLATDTEISTRVLYQMQKFYHAYPTIPSQDTKLGWSQYAQLATIDDKRIRNSLENTAIKYDLSANDLKKEIKQKRQITNNQALNEKTILKFSRGQLYTYKINSLLSADKIYFDCGFNIFGSALGQDFKEGDIVASRQIQGQFSMQKININKSQMHTYKAKVEKIVDGDTIRVILDLGFNIKHREIIRLAHINAPEKGTILGEKSTKKLKEILRNQEFIIIKTNKTDIYGRYVGDVFFSPEYDPDPQKVADEGTYLNQMLLDLGIVKSY